MLLEVDGVRILTDPMLSLRASPFQFVGPARLHAAPLALQDLKNIDAVVISHDHFDHLDMDTIKALARGGTQFFVGLGIGAHLERWDVPPAQIHEMDWWEHAQVRGVAIHCTPARHYSGRKGMDNSTLWASWMLKGSQHSAYFSGDTGYAGHFREVRERLGAPELALHQDRRLRRHLAGYSHGSGIRRARASRTGCDHVAARALGDVQPGVSRLGGAHPAQRGSRTCAGRADRHAPARREVRGRRAVRESGVVPEAILTCAAAARLAAMLGLTMQE